MRSTLQEDYGVRLDDGKNRAITQAWDESQQFVSLFHILPLNVIC